MVMLRDLIILMMEMVTIIVVMMNLRTEDFIMIL